MVREVKPNGRLLMTQLGGYAWNAVESENVTVHCVGDGRRYRGTIQTVNPSSHTSHQMREGHREEERMEVRLDARAATREETLALGIDVGDLVFFDPRVELTDTGYIKSRHLDDKAGVAVLYGVMLSLAELGLPPPSAPPSSSATTKRWRHGACTGIPDDVVELLVVDMAASTTGEHQNSDEYSVGICAKDSSGPYDVEMRRRLRACARRTGSLTRSIPIPITVRTAARSCAPEGVCAWDSSALALDASHGYERTHRDSLEATVQLALEYVLQPDA